MVLGQPLPRDTTAAHAIVRTDLPTSGSPSRIDTLLSGSQGRQSHSTFVGSTSARHRVTRPSLAGCPPRSPLRCARTQSSSTVPSASAVAIASRSRRLNSSGSSFRYSPPIASTHKYRRASTARCAGNLPALPSRIASTARPTCSGVGCSASGRSCRRSVLGRTVRGRRCTSPRTASPSRLARWVSEFGTRRGRRTQR